MNAADRRHDPDTELTESLWTGARFPNTVMRGQFLEQVRLWNRIEDLPRIQALPAPNGRDLKYWCADYRRCGLRKLVDSYGGKIVRERAVDARFESAAVASAFDWA